MTADAHQGLLPQEGTGAQADTRVQLRAILRKNVLLFKRNKKALSQEIW
eukprot:gene3678-13559_t